MRIPVTPGIRERASERDQSRETRVITRILISLNHPTRMRICIRGMIFGDIFRLEKKDVGRTLLNVSKF